MLVLLGISGMDRLAPEEKVLREDALKHLLDFARRGVPATKESVAGAVNRPVAQAAQVLEWLREAGLAVYDPPRWILTDQGKDYALRIVRAHRLYETYLANATAIRAEDWHSHAEDMEHRLSAQQVDQLARELGHPRFDPHGDPIPTREGAFPEIPNVPLCSCEQGFWGRISTVEDKPQPLFKELTALGIAVGARFELLDTTGDRWLINLEGRVTALSAAAAAALGVTPLRQPARFDPAQRRLCDLADGDSALLRGISPTCRGPERRRLLDLGFVAGGTVERAFNGVFKSPIVYRVRGTLVALRREQAELIFIA